MPLLAHLRLPNKPRALRAGATRSNLWRSLAFLGGTRQERLAETGRMLRKTSQVREPIDPGELNDRARPRMRGTWARWAGAGLLLIAALFGVSEVLVLRTNNQVPESAVAIVHRYGLADTVATLARSADRWIGRTSDFPAGSVAHVQPRSAPGFFIVHDSGGTFWALADRSPHRGQPLEYRDPLPGTADNLGGPQPGFYDPEAGANHTLDGLPFQGPAPRAMDPFPMVVNRDRLEVATHAFCPQDADVPMPDWCGSG